MFVVGSANLDLIVRAPALPRAGQTVIGSDLLQVAGGKGANQAVAGARLGASVTFIGNVGADAFGAAVYAALAAEHLELGSLARLAGRATGVALIVVDAEGENAIAVAPGANYDLSAAQVEAGLRTLRREDVVLAQLEVPLECVARAARLAKDAGARMILNVAPAQPLASTVLDQVYGLILNAGEAAVLSGTDEPASAARQLVCRVPTVVIVTLGGDGLLLATERGILHLPADSVSVVDTTGAGDAFCGAFAAALLDDSSLERAAQLARTAAALATTRRGAQASLPSRGEVEARLTRPDQPESRI
jgi:ribokinase